jgi:hypothetical protein
VFRVSAGDAEATTDRSALTTAVTTSTVAGFPLATGVG